MSINDARFKVHTVEITKQKVTHYVNYRGMPNKNSHYCVRKKVHVRILYSQTEIEETVTFFFDEKSSNPISQNFQRR